MKRHTPQEIVQTLRDERNAGKSVSEGAKRLRELETENARLKKLLAEAELDKAILREIASGNG